MNKKKTVTTDEKQAGNSRAKQAHILSIIAEAQRRYLTSSNIADIYRIATEEIQKLIIDGYTITTILDDDIQAQRVAAYSGFEGIEERVFDILHADPREMTFPLSKVPEADLRIFRSARLERYRDGIYGLGLQKIPRAVCTTLERFLGTEKTYTMGFLFEGRHLGGLILLPKIDISDIIWAIEMIVNQAAIVINQKRADIKLGKSEKVYHSIFETMLNGMAYCKMIFENGIPQDFIYLDINKAFEAQTGLKDVRGKPVSEVIPGIRASDPKLFEIYGRVALTGKPETFEIYVEALKMWFAVSVYSPQREYFVAVFDVITKRKEAEVRINHLNSILTVLRDVNQLITREKNVDQLLAKTCNLMIETRGFSFAWILLLDENYSYDHAAAASQLSMADSFLEEMKKGVFPPCVPRLLKKAQPFAMCNDIVNPKMQCLQGNLQTDSTGLISRLEYEDKIYGIIAVYVPRQMAGDAEEQSLFKELAEDLGFALHNIEAEERKRQMVESLRVSEERYHSVLDNMIEGCQIINFGWRYVYLNESAVKHSRKSRQELLGNSIIDVYPGIDDTELFTHLRECMYNRVPGFIKNEFGYPDGRKGIFELRIEPVPEGVFILSNDITEQIDAEKALKSREEQYHLLVETANEGITVAQNGMLKFVNKRMVEITGYPAEELLEMKMTDSVHPDDLPLLLDRYDKRIKNENTPGLFTFRIIHKSGRVIWLESNATAINWQGRPAVLNMLNDITQRKNLEKEGQDYTLRLKSTVEGSINSLAYIAETRDPYTAGHQQRVTRIALAIAGELGLPEDKIDTVRVAGMLHDIGKVKVPAEILSKPTNLSEAEIQLIRQHPGVSYDIIKTINMPWPAADIVQQHHERMNGSGYPSGLAGEEIIFEARILAVADVVEAMASHRPYRPAVGIEEALNEISRNSGTLYDEKVVGACLRLFHEKHFEI